MTKVVLGNIQKKMRRLRGVRKPYIYQAETSEQTPIQTPPPTEVNITEGERHGIAAAEKLHAHVGVNRLFTRRDRVCMLLFSALRVTSASISYQLLAARNRSNLE